MQRLEVSGAVRPIYGSLGVKRLICLVSAYVASSKDPRTWIPTFKGYMVSQNTSIHYEYTS